MGSGSRKSACARSTLTSALWWHCHFLKASILRLKPSQSLLNSPPPVIVLVYTYAQGLLRKLCNSSDVVPASKTLVDHVLPKRLPHQACDPLRIRDQKGFEMRQTQYQLLLFVLSTLVGKKTDQVIIEGLPHVLGKLHETVGAYAIASSNGQFV